MTVVSLHKHSASVVVINEVDSIVQNGDIITIHGVLATQTQPQNWQHNVNDWYVRILDS